MTLCLSAASCISSGVVGIHSNALATVHSTQSLASATWYILSSVFSCAIAVVETPAARIQAKRDFWSHVRARTASDHIFETGESFSPFSSCFKSWFILAIF